MYIQIRQIPHGPRGDCRGERVYALVADLVGVEIEVGEIPQRPTGERRGELFHANVTNIVLP